MIRLIRNRKSLYSQLAVLLIIAFLVSLAAFFASNAVGDQITDRIVKETDYVEKYNRSNLEKLQMFISENSISSKNIDALYDWQPSQSLVIFDVYRGDEWLYTSYLPDGRDVVVSNGVYDESSYMVTFSDCECDVFFYDTYTYRLTIYCTIIRLILSFVVFIIIFMVGVQKNIKYIRMLRDEIKQLEGGNLDYPITIEGSNEFTELARSLDDMRQSFIIQQKKEDELKSMNKALTAEISHDIRTPLTVLLLYTDALRQKKYTSEEELNQYLKRIEDKVHQIQTLADSIFEHSVDKPTISVGYAKKDEIAVRTAPENDVQRAFLRIAFDECLSEMSECLVEKGFTVDDRLEWRDETIEYMPEYIKRITDNILSNIIKYASADSPVMIQSLYEADAVDLIFTNEVSKSICDVNSTKIGIKNIEHMMAEMGGSCFTENDGECFEIGLMFPTSDKADA